MWQSLEILNIFSTLNLKQIFWKMKTFFEELDYRFLVESTKIENAIFPYKTALTEANVNTNGMGSIKWTFYKERSFSRNYFISRIFCFSLRTFFKDLIWCTNYPIVHIHTFRKRWSFIWGCFFPVSIIKKWF